MQILPLETSNGAQPQGGGEVGLGPMAPPQGQAPAGKPPALDVALSGLKEARARMDVVREQLDRLVSLGDSVSIKDVTKAASIAVANGVQAEGMAALIADAPQKPERLAEWLQMQDANIRQKEQQLDQVMQVVGHKLAVQGFTELMQGHEAAQAQEPAPAGMMEG